MDCLRKCILNLEIFEELTHDSNSFILGTIFITLVIQIPLRYQIVGNESPVEAGLRLIAFGAAIPVGSTSSALLCQKRRVPPIFLFLLSSIFTILGLVFMSRVAIEDISWNGLYGLQFVTGVGCGIMMGLVTILPPFVAEQEDLGMFPSYPSSLVFSSFVTNSCLQFNLQQPAPQA